MDPLPEHAPTRVGRYRLLARLGAGGFGEVFLARSPTRHVAIKQIRGEILGDDEFRERFAREMALARQVAGPYTAAVIDADAHAERPWLATEYVPGPSLQQAVRHGGPLPGPALRILAAGLAEALWAVHRTGIMHRDLKPANVLLAEDSPRVIDFGIAKAAQDSAATPLTPTGGVLGTPAYMAPEQILNRELGPHSDIFALGGVLCFAATGEPPFGPTDPAVFHRIQHAEPPLEHLPLEIRELAAACLERRPAGRPDPAQLLDHLGEVDLAAPAWPPQKVRDRITALRHELQTLKTRPETPATNPQDPVPRTRPETPPTAPTPEPEESPQSTSPTRRIAPPPPSPVPRSPAPPPVTPPPPQPPPSDLPGLMTLPEPPSAGRLGAGVVLAVVLIIVAWLALSEDEEESAATEESREPDTTPPPASDDPTEPAPLDDAEQVFVAPEELLATAWTPEGDVLAAGSDDDTVLRLLDPDTDEWHRLPGSENATNAAFAPDGTRVAGLVHGNLVDTILTLKVWNTEDRSLLFESDTFHQDSGGGLQFSPDANSVAVTSTAGVVVFDSETGAEQTELEMETERDVMGSIPTRTEIVHLRWSPDGGQLAGITDDWSGTDHDLVLWDASTGAVTHHGPGLGTDTPASLAYSPDGHLLAVVRSSTVLLVDPGDGGRVHNVSSCRQAPAFAPAEPLLGCADRDGTVRLLDLDDAEDPQDDEERATMSHAGGAEVEGVAFHPDGDRVLTRTSTTLAVWEAPNG